MQKYKIKILIKIDHKTSSGFTSSGFLEPVSPLKIESEIPAKDLLNKPLLQFQIYSPTKSWAKTSLGIVTDWEKVEGDFNQDSNFKSNSDSSRNVEATIRWPDWFIKELTQRWNEDLLLKENQGFDNVIDFLNGMVSNGNAPNDIVNWLESRKSPVCDGGDASCRQSVELGWLVGAWPVLYSTLAEAGELQDPSRMIEEAALIVAEAAGWEGDV